MQSGRSEGNYPHAAMSSPQHSTTHCMTSQRSTILRRDTRRWKNKVK